MSHRSRTTVAAVLLVAVTGCGSGSKPAHHPARTVSASRSTPTPTATATPAKAAVGSRYVDARESEGVEVIRPPRHLGRHVSRLVNLTPDSFPVGRPKRATLGEIDIGAGLPPVGVSVWVANAAFECGTPFLATPGHGYRVRCTITASRPGTVRIRLTEHNAKTGAPGSRFTAHAPAR